MSALLFFDEQRFQKALEQENPVTVFRDAIQAANTHFDNRFYEGEDVRTLVNERARFVDRLLHFAWQYFDIGDTISLIAVGGYGRMELHPHSDIDALILLSAEPDAEMRHTLERFITFLWDLNLNIGHSVRTLQNAYKQRLMTSPLPPTCWNHAHWLAIANCALKCAVKLMRAISGPAANFSMPNGMSNRIVTPNITIPNTTLNPISRMHRAACAIYRPSCGLPNAISMWKKSAIWCA
jgi:hypothetical protein